MDISDIFKLSRMSRWDAVEYIRLHPGYIYDLVVFTADWISAGSTKRIERSLSQQKKEE